MEAKYESADSIIFFNLSKDISMYVFLKLPVKSILRFRCVCKQWRRLLSDPEFARMHLNHVTRDHSRNCHKLLLGYNFNSFYLVDYEASIGNRCAVRRDFPLESSQYVHILGSCSGLLCVAIDHKKKGYRLNFKIVLWNPSTGDYKILPDATPLIDTSGHTNSYQFVGFGYDSSVGDYKMVRVIFRPRYQVDVYSLKTNSWKIIEETPPTGIRVSVILGGTTMNGYIYWLVDGDQRGKDDRFIVGFDLKNEKFIELPMPPNCPSRAELVMTGGRIGIYYTYWDPNFSAELWTRKEDKKDGEWIKLMTISSDVHCTINNWRFSRMDPICFLKNGRVRLYIRESGSIRRYVECDPKSNSITETVNIDMISSHSWGWDCITYTESLVSPNTWNV